MLVKIDAKNVLKQNKLITRQEFAENYSLRYNIPIQKVKEQIKILKQSFTCCFSQDGPIIFTALWNKKPRFCWGEFALLLNMKNLAACKAIGGRHRIDFGGGNFAYHPNLHTDIWAMRKDCPKICLGASLTNVIETCLRSGEIVLACEEMVYMLNRTSYNDELYKYWNKILYTNCAACGCSINIGQKLCGRCSKPR